MSIIEKIITERMNATPGEHISEEIGHGFEGGGILSEANVWGMVYITPDGHLSNAQVENPAKSDVRFLVYLHDKILKLTIAAVVDGDKWQSAVVEMERTVNGGKTNADVIDSARSYLVDDAAYPSEMAIFKTMGPQDAKMIEQAIHKYMETHAPEQK